MTRRFLRLEDFYGISAEHYDADYRARGRVDDIAMYVELARKSGGPVLEMGCGTGRVLLPTAREGVQIHGIDSSEDMLRQLRHALSHEPPEVQDRVEISRGDIRTAHVPGAFALVMAPFRVAQHLLTLADQTAWLRNVKRHLRPGGELLFDVFNPDFSRMTEPGLQLELERVGPGGQGTIRRYAQIQPDLEKQILNIEMTWVREDSAAQRISERRGEFQMRWYTRPQLEELLGSESFEVLDYWGSFQHELFAPESTEQVVRAKVKGH
jgi:SAM-dependent methyltransferase